MYSMYSMSHYQNLDIYKLDLKQEFDNTVTNKRISNEDGCGSLLIVGEHIAPIPELPIIKGLRPVTNDCIRKYLTNLGNDNIAVALINGHATSDIGDYYYCNYCS